MLDKSPENTMENQKKKKRIINNLVLSLEVQMNRFKISYFGYAKITASPQLTVRKWNIGH